MQQSSAVANEEAKPTSQQPRVGGWLLFLCVLLTLIFPLLWATTFAITVAVLLEELRPEVRSEMAWLFAGIAVPYVLRLGFGIVVGRALWNVKGYAIRIADIYFVVLPVIAILGTIAVAIFATFNSLIIVWPILEIWWSAIWLAYLHKSVRVQQTFHRP